MTEAAGLGIQYKTWKTCDIVRKYFKYKELLI